MSSNCWFWKPPSTCRVFDVLGVSFYFGWSIWICVSCLNLWLFANLMFPLIFINENLQIACPHCFHQRVVFLMSFVFPFTWAYRSGFVCLLWTYSFSQISCFYWSSYTKTSNCVSPLLPSTCCVFDFTGVSVDFGLELCFQH